MRALRRSARDVDLLRVPAAELTHCYASASGKIVRHKPGCTIGHPRCKWRRKDAGQVVCECPSYLFPHRQGSGLCGRHVYGQWHRKASDPDRVDTTVEKSGKRERFATLKRAVEHARMIADTTRRQVAVALGDRVVHVARPSARRLQALRDLVPVEKRAESRTLGLFTGKTKLEEGGAKGRHDWKSEAQKANRELAECRKTGRDPSPRTKRFLAWHKKMMAEKREDFRAMTHNVGTLAKAVATGSTIEAIRSGKLQSVRTPIGGWRLGAKESRKARKRFMRDEACPPTKRSSYPAPVNLEAAIESARPTSRTGLRERGRGAAAVGHGSRAQYVREVILLMGSGHGLSAPAGLRLVSTWARHVDAAWRAGKTACWTADHVVKYDRRGMCPCEGSGRDCARCATRRKRQ